MDLKRIKNWVDLEDSTVCVAGAYVHKAKHKLNANARVVKSPSLSVRISESLNQQWVKELKVQTYSFVQH